MIYMTLDGVPSHKVDLYVKTHRQLIAELTESIFEVSGRDGFYDMENNRRVSIVHEVDFFMQGKNFPDLRQRARMIAAWLARKGKITFSDEPERYYEGRCYSGPTLEQNLSPSGRFSASFKCQPYAKAWLPTLIEQEGTGSVSIPLAYQGTAPTCCRITVQNIGSTSITGLELEHLFGR